jgi:hypothetical protein
MMHRTQICIPDRDMEKLWSMKEITGKSVGEIVRGIISEYLDKQDKREYEVKKSIGSKLRGA